MGRRLEVAPGLSNKLYLNEIRSLLGTRKNLIIISIVNE